MTPNIGRSLLLMATKDTQKHLKSKNTLNAVQHWNSYVNATLASASRHLDRKRTKFFSLAKLIFGKEKTETNRSALISTKI